MPPGFRRSQILLLLVFILILAGITLLVRHTRSPEIGLGRPEPEIPLYPGATEVVRHMNEVIGSQILAFQSTDSYPSAKVLDYYRQTLEATGYRPARPLQPAWQPAEVSEKGRSLVLNANWIDPEGLRLLELRISAREKFNRDPESGRLINTEVLPGQKVEILLSRKVFISSGQGESHSPQRAQSEN